MGNPQHIEWLMEGIEAWNNRRENDDFQPDFSDINFAVALSGSDLIGSEGTLNLFLVNLSNANLMKAELSEANLGLSNLTRANLSGAKLRNTDFKWANASLASFWAAELTGADLRAADLNGTNFSGAQLWGANVQTLEYPTKGRRHIFSKKRLELTDTIGLDQSQLDTMIGDSGTILPDHLTRPSHWPDLDFDTSELNPSPPGPDIPVLPDRPAGNRVELDAASKLTLGFDEPAPMRSDLEILFADLKTSINDLSNIGSLDNLSPLFAQGLSRFLDQIPDEFVDLEQVRFGVGTETLRLRYNAEKAYLLTVAPEKTGHIQAVLYVSDLIAARLPEWKRFIEEEEDAKTIFQARREDAEQLLQDAAERLSTAPEQFDISLFTRVREYLDTQTIEGYLAAKDLLLSIAHKTFTLVRKLTGDVASETRKQAIQNIARALQIELGAVLLELAGLLPKELSWLVRWMDYLATVLPPL